MKRLISFSMLMIAMSFLLASCGASRHVSVSSNADAYNYDIQYVKTAGDGIVAVAVSSYGKTANEALKSCAKSAVHGVIFKGYSGGGAAQPAIAKEPGAEYDHLDYFRDFFAENGEYNRYISAIKPSGEAVVKVGRQYKASQIVFVNKKGLRKALEEAGIVKALNAGF